MEDVKKKNVVNFIDPSSFFFFRLEEQTKKLHKDMKKSTEADLGL